MRPTTNRNYLVYCPVKGRQCRGDFFGEDRLYDIAVNDWTGNGDGWDAAEYVFTTTGHKWPCAKQNLPEINKKYEYYAFFDYDIAISTSDMNRLFQIGESLRLDLFQAALCPNSKSAYRHLFARDGSLARSTAFVEIMMPVFSQFALDLCFESFGESESGYGLDFYWPRLLEGKNIGVIDAVIASHEGPFESHNWKLANGLSPLQELEAFVQSHQFDFHSPPTPIYAPRDSSLRPLGNSSVGSIE
ncbi:DUF707 domain-containing protein [Blastopirellula marina]|uniref:DUF707 domain-containing protein n=1 Tax=Blastopirellula marina TaxID=124 RepID=A0A2S8GH80_9BACT|nr:DUF707 domain-containing protein [Blastopirellula marina]PQO43822.1 hypothetical protein C5Y93_21795 [Blastopirellula marina]